MNPTPHSGFTFQTVILAAGGKSTRMGIPKGLLQTSDDPTHLGKPWILSQIDALFSVVPSSIHIALGFHAELYLPHLPTPHPRLSYSIHPSPEGGPFETLCCALKTLLHPLNGLDTLLRADPSPWIGYLPIDVPCPPRAFWQNLQAAQIPNKSQVLLPTHHGRGGHPIFFSPQFANALLSLPSAHPARRLDRMIQSLPAEKKFRFETECENILLNLNTPEDWKRYQTAP